MLHGLQVTGNRGKQKLEKIQYNLIKQGPENFMFYMWNVILSTDSVNSFKNIDINTSFTNCSYRSGHKLTNYEILQATEHPHFTNCTQEFKFLPFQSHGSSRIKRSAAFIITNLFIWQNKHTSNSLVTSTGTTCVTGKHRTPPAPPSTSVKWKLQCVLCCAVDPLGWSVPKSVHMTMALS